MAMVAVFHRSVWHWCAEWRQEQWILRVVVLVVCFGAGCRCLMSLLEASSARQGSGSRDDGERGDNVTLCNSTSRARYCRPVSKRSTERNDIWTSKYRKRQALGRFQDCRSFASCTAMFLLYTFRCDRCLYRLLY